MTRISRVSGRVPGLTALWLCFWLMSAHAELQFPSLSGRVVDQLNILSAQQKATLENQLRAHEQATTNQVVVAIVSSLQGTSIDDYGYQLGRAWGIGQKDNNNGVILLVAPNERKVRIEVGYGLEGTLTDAISSNIIQTRVLPPFREGQFAVGIMQGSNAIIDALGGQYQFTEPNNSGNNQDQLPWWVIFFIPFIFLRRLRFGRYGHHGPYYGPGGRHGSRRGGFSGGGGSFGGGGASGGW